MKGLDDLTYWEEKDLYFGFDVVRRGGRLDTQHHLFWSNWVQRQRKRLVVSEGWPAFQEVMQKCASFREDEDTLVVFLLLDMDSQGEETRGLLNGYMRDKEIPDGVIAQRQRGAVYPVEGRPSMCIAAARTINIKRGLVHCPIGMSKSDWLLWACKRGQTHRRWFGIGVGFHALGMRVVHDYDGQASTCICRSVPHFARLLYTAFKCSLGSTKDRDIISAQIKQLIEQMGGEADPVSRRFLQGELDAKRGLHARMLQYPLRLDDSSIDEWVLDGVKMPTPSFVSGISCMVEDFVVASLPLLIIGYSDVQAHLPGGGPALSTVLETLHSLHARLLCLEGASHG